MNPLASWCGIAVGLLGLTAPCFAAKIPAGRTLEARALVSTGSKISKSGDPIQAVLIAPVIEQGRQVLPSGLIVEGHIEKAAPLGFGFRRQTAKLAYRFDRLLLPGGVVIPIDAKLRLVDMAREQVDASGTVYGIRPTTNVSSSLAVYAWRLAWLEPMVALPVWGLKFTFARSPDPEIYFPAGTELVLELRQPVELPEDTINLAPVAQLTARDVQATRSLLEITNGYQALDKNGRPSDRVNVVLIGSDSELKSAFEGSGWKGADRRSFKSLFKTYRSVVERMGYQRAPVNNLLLAGRAPAMVYQKSLNTFAKRHHGRLWRGPSVGNGKHVWAMAATEDTGIHFSLKKIRFVHRTDPNIDNERAKVVTDLVFTGCVSSAGLVAPTVHLGLEGTPVTGATTTDRRLAVVRLNNCLSQHGAESIRAGEASKRHKAGQIWTSFQDDLIRSNLIFIGVNTTRLATATKSLFAKKPKSPRGNEWAEEQGRWLAASTPIYTDILSADLPVAPGSVQAPD